MIKYTTLRDLTRSRHLTLKEVRALPVGTFLNIIVKIDHEPPHPLTIHSILNRIVFCKKGLGKILTVVKAEAEEGSTLPLPFIKLVPVDSGNFFLLEATTKNIYLKQDVYTYGYIFFSSHTKAKLQLRKRRTY